MCYSCMIFMLINFSHRLNPLFRAHRSIIITVSGIVLDLIAEADQLLKFFVDPADTKPFGLYITGYTSFSFDNH